MASNVDSTIAVNIEAKVDDLQKGLDKASSAIDDFSKGIVGAAAKFDILTDAFDKLKELAEVPLELMKAFAEMGEQIERTSQITGMSTDEVQQFQFAVKMTGGDAETASSSLQRFERNIAQAASGTGPAAKAFAALHISVKDTSGEIRPLSSLLADIAEKFEAAGNGASKTQIAVLLGSRGFANLIPLLNKGKEGLDELNKTFDETDSKMTGQMIAHSTALSESLHVLDAAWEGLKNHIIDQVAPAFTKLVNLATKLLETLDKLGQMTVYIPIPKWLGGEGMTPPETQLGEENSNGSDTMADPNFLNNVNPPKKPQLAPIDTGASSGKDDSDAIAKSDLATYLDFLKLKLQAAKDSDEEAVASGQMSKIQQLADLEAFTKKEQAASEQALQTEIDNDTEGTKEWEAAYNKKFLVTQQYENQIARIQTQMTQQAATEQKKSWDDVFNTIDKSMDTMLQGVLQGTQTWQQAMARLFDNMALTFIENVAKMTLRWLAFEALKNMGSGFSAAASAVGSGLPSAVGGSQSGGLLNEAITALTTALGLSTVTQNVSTDTLSVSVDINTGALEENTMALIASKAIPSYDVGSWNLPSDTMAMVHAGEMIVPASIASGIRSGASSIGGGGAGGAGGASVYINLSSIDNQTGTQFLMNNMGTIASGIATAIRNNNSSLSSVSH